MNTNCGAVVIYRRAGNEFGFAHMLTEVPLRSQVTCPGTNEPWRENMG